MKQQSETWVQNTVDTLNKKKIQAYKFTGQFQGVTSRDEKILIEGFQKQTDLCIFTLEKIDTKYAEFIAALLSMCKKVSTMSLNQVSSVALKKLFEKDPSYYGEVVNIEINNLDESAISMLFSQFYKLTKLRTLILKDSNETTINKVLFELQNQTQIDILRFVDNLKFKKENLISGINKAVNIKYVFILDTFPEKSEIIPKLRDDITVKEKDKNGYRIIKQPEKIVLPVKVTNNAVEHPLNKTPQNQTNKPLTIIKDDDTKSTTADSQLLDEITNLKALLEFSKNENKFLRKENQELLKIINNLASKLSTTMTEKPIIPTTTPPVFSPGVIKPLSEQKAKEAAIPPLVNAHFQTSPIHPVLSFFGINTPLQSSMPNMPARNGAITPPAFMPMNEASKVPSVAHLKPLSKQNGHPLPEMQAKMLLASNSINPKKHELAVDLTTDQPHSKKPKIQNGSTSASVSTINNLSSLKLSPAEKSLMQTFASPTKNK